MMTKPGNVGKYLPGIIEGLWGKQLFIVGKLYWEKSYSLGNCPINELKPMPNQ